MEPEQLMLMLLDQAWVQGWFLLQLVVPDRLQVLLLRRQKNGKAEKKQVKPIVVFCVIHYTSRIRAKLYIPSTLNTDYLHVAQKIEL